MTLIELLVVLGVIGLIVGVSVPAFTSFTKSLRLKTTTRKVVGLLNLARSLAISTREKHALVVDLERGEISVVNQVSDEALEQTVELPRTVTLEIQVGGKPAPETQVVLRPTGALTGRTVTLVFSDRHKSHTVTVTVPGCRSVR